MPARRPMSRELALATLATQRNKAPRHESVRAASGYRDVWPRNRRSRADVFRSSSLAAGRFHRRHMRRSGLLLVCSSLSSPCISSPHARAAFLLDPSARSSIPLGTIPGDARYEPKVAVVASSIMFSRSIRALKGLRRSTDPVFTMNFHVAMGETRSLQATEALPTPDCE